MTKEMIFVIQHAWENKIDGVIKRTVDLEKLKKAKKFDEVPTKIEVLLDFTKGKLVFDNTENLITKDDITHYSKHWEIAVKIFMDSDYAEKYGA